MGRGALAACLVIAALAPLSARAQLGDPLGEEVPPPDPGAQPPPEEDWARYRAAVQSAIRFRTPEGRAELEAIAAEETPMGRAARETLSALEATLDSPEVRPPLPNSEPPAPREHDPTGAIAELAVGQAFNGGTLGVWFCLLASCAEPALYAGLSLVGVAGALTLSILVPDRSFHNGQAAVIGWGSFWGGGIGGLILGIIAGADVNGIGGTLLLSQTIGTLTGIGLAWLSPDEGRVEMAAWTGLWFGALSVMGMGIANFQGLDQRSGFTIPLVAAVSGITAGALLGEIYPMGRGRILLATGAGVLGAGVGMGLTVLIANTYVGEAFWSAAMIGALAGLVVTAAVTEDLDRDIRAPDLSVSLAPIEGGALAGLYGSF